MNQAEREYYVARIAAGIEDDRRPSKMAVGQRAAAEKARSDRARTIHLDLAEQYQRVVDGKQAPPTSAE